MGIGTADHAQNEQVAGYLEAVLEDGDPRLIVAAIGDIARAKGMMQLARETGLTREGLYNAFGSNGNPSFATVVKVARSLGVRFSARSAVSPAAKRAKRAA